MRSVEQNANRMAHQFETVMNTSKSNFRQAFASFSRALIKGTIVAIAASVLTGSPAFAANGFAHSGSPKYPADFKQFDYVNPAAPKGGTLNLATSGPSGGQGSNFDKLNPFTFKGKVPPGILDLMFDTLTVYSLDETNTQYGLIADDIVAAKDFSSVQFHINEKARFSNGDAIRAADVKYAFDTLTGKKASPVFRSYFDEIEHVVVIDAQTVRFDFKRKGRDLVFIAGSLPVFSPKWEKTGGFAADKQVAPIASGPYLIERAVVGHDVIFKRNPDYWAKDLPTRRGQFNFNRIVYKLYSDKNTLVSAIRGGEVDFGSGNQMRDLCCQYIGRRFDDGRIIKEIFPHKNPPAMNGYVVNLRKKRFQDPRVRLALNYAYDFELINDKIFDGEFKRISSYFSYSPLEAKGLPSPAELKLLEPYRAQLDPAVFGPMFEQPNTTPPNSIRKNLTKALQLFAEAGWHNKDGVLRNDKGEPFVIEFSTSRGQSPYNDPYYINLSKIGVIVKKRVADGTTDRSRMKKFDYDFTSLALREGRMPGAELWRNFNSADADVPGSQNITGVKSPVVDALIQKLIDAGSEEELETTAHALDRVMVHSHYVLPWRYLTQHYTMRNSLLQHPKILPLYYGAEEWAEATWWYGS